MIKIFCKISALLLLLLFMKHIWSNYTSKYWAYLKPVENK